MPWAHRRVQVIVPYAFRQMHSPLLMHMLWLCGWGRACAQVTASLKVQRNPLRNHYNGPGGLLEAMDYSFP